MALSLTPQRLQAAAAAAALIKKPVFTANMFSLLPHHFRTEAQSHPRLYTLQLKIGSEDARESQREEDVDGPDEESAVTKAGIECRPIVCNPVYKHCLASIIQKEKEEESGKKSLHGCKVTPLSLRHLFVTAPGLVDMATRLGIPFPSQAQLDSAAKKMPENNHSSSSSSSKATTTPPTTMTRSRTMLLETLLFKQEAVNQRVTAPSRFAPYEPAQSGGLVNLNFVNRKDLAWKMGAHFLELARMQASRAAGAGSCGIQDSVDGGGGEGHHPGHQLLGGDGPVREWLFCRDSSELLVNHRSTFGDFNSRQVMAAITAYRQFLPGEYLSQYWISVDTLNQRKVQHYTDRTKVVPAAAAAAAAAAAVIPSPPGGTPLEPTPLVEAAAATLTEDDSFPAAATAIENQLNDIRKAAILNAQLGQPLRLPLGPSMYTAADLRQEAWPQLHDALQQVLSQQEEVEKENSVLGPIAYSEDELVQSWSDSIVADDMSPLRHYLTSLRQQESLDAFGTSV